MNYMILTGDTEAELYDQVNSFLDKGWICAGGVSVTAKATKGYYLYAQAMVSHRKYLDQL